MQQTLSNTRSKINFWRSLTRAIFCICISVAVPELVFATDDLSSKNEPQRAINPGKPRKPTVLIVKPIPPEPPQPDSFVANPKPDPDNNGNDSGVPIPGTPDSDQIDIPEPRRPVVVDPSRPSDTEPDSDQDPGKTERSGADHRIQEPGFYINSLNDFKFQTPLL